jgi:hypothetical protein
MKDTDKNLEVEKVIERLPNELCSSFIQFVYNGGYQLKVCNGHVRIAKNNMVAKVEFNGEIEESYKMDSNCQKLFEQFTRWWMRNGGDALTVLASEMKSTFIFTQKEVVKFGYLGMVA